MNFVGVTDSEDHLLTGMNESMTFDEGINTRMWWVVLLRCEVDGHICKREMFYDRAGVNQQMLLFFSLMPVFMIKK